MFGGVEVNIEAHTLFWCSARDLLGKDGKAVPKVSIKTHMFGGCKVNIEAHNVEHTLFWCSVSDLLGKDGKAVPKVSIKAHMFGGCKVNIKAHKVGIKTSKHTCLVVAK